MSEPTYFYDATAQTIIVGDEPRKCVRCRRGPEPTAINQFAAICLCVQCLSQLAEAVAKNFPKVRDRG